MMNQADVLNGLNGTEIEKKRASEYICSLLTESDKRGCRDKVEAFVKNHPDAKIWGDVAELHSIDDFFARVLLKDQTQTTLPAAAPAGETEFFPVAAASSAPMAIQNPQTAVYIPTKEEIELLRKTIITGNVTDEKIILMMILARKYNLDPFKREIWCLPTQSAIFIGRDGFLALAHRSGNLDGMDTDFGYDEKGKLESATTTVWTKTMSHPIKFTAYLDEFGRGKSGNWLTMPRVMLQKCAEASALRRAFSVTGLYLEEEMDETPRA